MTRKFNSAFIALAVILPVLLGAGVSTLVVFKPWGVHDLERDAYEKIISSIRLKEKLADVPRPIITVESATIDLSIQQPGEVVPFEFRVGNEGKEPLIIRDAQTVPQDLKLDFASINLSPEESQTLTGRWTLPSDGEGEASTGFTIETNDPIYPTVRLEVKAKLAAAWAITGDLAAAIVKPGAVSTAESVIYSQRFAALVIETEALDNAAEVTIEPILDQPLLSGLGAKSAYRIIARQPQQERMKSFKYKVRFKAWSPEEPNVEGALEAVFGGRFLPWIAFYGPDLHSEKGLEIGVVDTLRDSDKSWNLFVRYKGDNPPSGLVVKRVMPESLAVSLTPVPGKTSDYRVAITVPIDAAPVDFQGQTQGFIEIANADNPEQSNWLPIRGSIVSGKVAGKPVTKVSN